MNKEMRNNRKKTYLEVTESAEDTEERREESGL